jgi:hypothetical protein
MGRVGILPIFYTAGNYGLNHIRRGQHETCLPFIGMRKSHFAHFVHWNEDSLLFAQILHALYNVRKDCSDT